MPDLMTNGTNYELILFDLDDTLFDSQKTEKLAFASTLKHFNIKDETGDLLKKYKELSQSLWRDYSAGLITKEYVKVQRYTDLFRMLEVNFCPIEASEHHVEAWIAHPYLLDGAVEVCAELKSRGHKVGIVTNGFQETQSKRLEKTLLKAHIDFMVVPEECGFSKPHGQIFDYTFKKANHSDKATTIMIGDHLETDILGAHKYDIKSAWFNHKKVENNFDYKPSFEFHDLKELLIHL